MIPQSIKSRPWIFVTVVFTAFVAWWVYFITLAVKNAPPEVPLITRSSHAGH